MIEYDIDKKVWIAIGFSKLFQGKVIHKFTHYDQILYVIEVDTHIEPVYYVRSWEEISETKKGPLNAFAKYFTKSVSSIGKASVSKTEEVSSILTADATKNGD